MSITIKKDAWRIKDDNGVYRSADLFSTMLPSEAQQLVEETQAEFTGMQNQLTSLAATKKQEISDEGLAQVTAVNTKGDEVLASIPNDYTITTHAVDAILHGGFIYSEKDKNSIVNFDDGADGMLIKSLVADIEPVQDLHGYDKPWPGGTINRIDATAVDDSNLYINANTGSQVVPGSGVWRKTDYIAVKPGETLYIGQINASATVPGLAFYDSSKNYKSGVNANTLSSNNNVVTVPQNVAYMRHSFRIDEGYNTDWETTVYIVDNADTHEWVPYENICPIIGHTNTTISKSGSDTSNPETLTVSWQDSAGTVYGGMIDVVSGELMITHMSTNVGALTWTYAASSNFFNTNNNDFKLSENIDSIADIYCSFLKPESARHANSSSYDMIIAMSPSAHCIIVRCSSYTSADEFKAAFANEQIVYPLSEPVKVTLTPQQITCLSGVNNIWADTGDVTVTYPVDTKTYIDRKIQEAIDGLSGS